MKILVAVLAHTCWIHTSVSRLLSEMNKSVDILYVEYGKVDEARNFSVKNALDGEYDYLIMIDHDNPCTRNPVELCKLGKNIIFCPTPTIDKNVVAWNVHPFPKDQGLYEVIDGGTGCVVLSKKVLELPKPLFRTQLDEEGLIDYGEDIYFCNKAREAGFTLYAHSDYICDHFHEINLRILRKA